MDECPERRVDSDAIIVQISPWGEFFVWLANHVEILRRKHRIIGHLSAGSNGASSNAAHSIYLPLILSFEETVFLLFREIATLESAKSVRSLHPPSLQALYNFDVTLSKHYQESTELYKKQKRLKTLCHYSEILKGQKKRKERQALKSGEKIPIPNERLGSKRSERKKLRHLKRRKMSSAAESMEGYLDDDHAFMENNTQDEDEHDDSLAQGPLPTLEELISAANAQEEQTRMINFIPIHRPRPTPKEWVRAEEHSPLLVPSAAKGSIEKVAQWLLEVTLKSRAENEDVESTIVRCRVFEDLWSKGFYVTCGAAKMGGDFLVYQGDPLFYHASHIIIANRPQSPIYLSRLAASLRIANNVRKALVFATTKSDHQEEQTNARSINYTSLYWTGSRIPPRKCTAPFMK